MNINGGNCLEIKFIQAAEYNVMEYLEEPLPFTHVYLHKTSVYEVRDSLTERVFTSLYLLFGFELIRLIMPAASHFVKDLSSDLKNWSLISAQTLLHVFE